MGSLFKIPEAAPAPAAAPVVDEPVAVIPHKGDPDSMRARRKSLARRKATSGKQSTILTSADKLGG
jgi:hypothetical protein